MPPSGAQRLKSFFPPLVQRQVVRTEAPLSFCCKQTLGVKAPVYEVTTETVYRLCGWVKVYSHGMKGMFLHLLKIKVTMDSAVVEYALLS